ncbi:DUF6079 family protein [Paenibacillus rhizosphaerae]|uniref:DUF6079 family protein n=1 Tax=Paenibacillus rhizosphaerae TaxID=297318 RepID=UPI001C84D7F8
MAAFHDGCPDYGCNVGDRWMISFIVNMQQTTLILNLELFQATGEAVQSIHLRWITRIQELLFHIFKFQCVASERGRVKGRTGQNSMTLHRTHLPISKN